ncbi:unnamed protein product, partial [Effrenium voratum]
QASQKRSRAILLLLPLIFLGAWHCWKVSGRPASSEPTRSAGVQSELPRPSLTAAAKEAPSFSKWDEVDAAAAEADAVDAVLQMRMEDAEKLSSTAPSPKTRSRPTCKSGPGAENQEMVVLEDVEAGRFPRVHDDLANQTRSSDGAWSGLPVLTAFASLMFGYAGKIA